VKKYKVTPPAYLTDGRNDIIKSRLLVCWSDANVPLDLSMKEAAQNKLVRYTRDSRGFITSLTILKDSPHMVPWCQGLLTEIPADDTTLQD